MSLASLFTSFTFFYLFLPFCAHCSWPEPSDWPRIMSLGAFRAVYWIKCESAPPLSSFLSSPLLGGTCVDGSCPSQVHTVFMGKKYLTNEALVKRNALKKETKISFQLAPPISVSNGTSAIKASADIGQYQRKHWRQQTFNILLSTAECPDKKGSVSY